MIEVDRGACHDVDPAVLNPEPGDEIAVVRARQLCNACAIRLECLAVALRTRHPLDGIWGGLTSAERARFSTPQPT